MTVATDGAEMYKTERVRSRGRDFPAGFAEAEAAETFGALDARCGTDHLLETTSADRERIFNLGYYTWVEQQGVRSATSPPGGGVPSGQGCAESWPRGTR